MPQHLRDGRRSLGALMLALIAASILGGCSGAYSTGRDKMPLDETGSWTFRDPTEKELLLTRSDFSVEIVRFTDSRRPRSMEIESKDQLIYTYDPDVLMGGVSYQVPAILGKFLSYRPREAKHYKIEIDLKRFVTTIKTGTLLSGSWGRYNVDMEFEVLARRPDSSVALKRTYRYNEMQRRKDYSGRGPTKERDRARMYDLAESIMRNAAQDIGWDIRQRDARRWKVEAPQDIPTRLNLPPVDRARGTLEDNSAPIIVPSVPSDAPTDMWIDSPSYDDKGVPAPEGIPAAVVL